MDLWRRATEHVIHSFEILVEESDFPPLVLVPYFTLGQDFFPPNLFFGGCIALSARRWFFRSNPRSRTLAIPKFPPVCLCTRVTCLSCCFHCHSSRTWLGLLFRRRKKSYRRAMCLRHGFVYKTLTGNGLCVLLKVVVLLIQRLSKKTKRCDF
jgi:hypothetical protein